MRRPTQAARFYRSHTSVLVFVRPIFGVKDNNVRAAYELGSFIVPPYPLAVQLMIALIRNSKQGTTRQRGSRIEHRRPQKRLL